MAFLLGSMCQKLEGNKHLTSDTEVIEIAATEEISVPLFTSETKKEIIVKVNDEVKVGTMLARRCDHFEVPIFSPVSGVVIDIKKKISANLTPIEHVVIKNDFKYTTEFIEPLDMKSASREQLIERVKQLGIIGCGGAAFPTYAKYATAKDIHTVIINAVECEPFITSDYRNMHMNLSYMIDGVEAFIKMAQCQKAIIAIKMDKVELINKVKEACKNNSQIDVVGVRDVYPMGWERTLIYELTKKRYTRLPSEVGIIVNNATTAIAVAKACHLAEPILKKMVTVSGNGVNKPSNVIVPIGVMVKDVINACGGYNGEEVTLIAGGPMMGKAIPNDLWSIAPCANAITVLKTEPKEAIACLRCGKCSDACPTGLQPVRINTALKTKDKETIIKLDAASCVECGLCSYVCPSNIEVSDGVRKAKQLVAVKKK